MLCLRREAQDMERPAAPMLRRDRRLFQTHVGLGSANSAGGDAVAQQSFFTGPGLILGVDIKRSAAEVDFRVGLVEVKRWDQMAVLEHQHGLDQARGSCSRVKMANVALNRA